MEMCLIHSGIMHCLFWTVNIFSGKTGLKNQAHDKDIKTENMTHQNDVRIEVTIYEDDTVVRGSSYDIREIDIPMVLSRIFF
jgi:hypothetical protein